jgi:hypothetical protein
MQTTKPESKDITLKYPVGDLKALTMRRPKVLDMMASASSAGDEIEQAIALISNLCLISPAAVEDMDAGDFKRLNTAFADLTASDPVKDYEPGKAIMLGVPVVIEGGTKVTAITLRKPTVKDLKTARKGATGDINQEVALFSLLSGLSTESIQGLDWADYLTLKGIYGDFLA